MLILLSTFLHALRVLLSLLEAALVVFLRALLIVLSALLNALVVFLSLLETTLSFFLATLRVLLGLLDARLALGLQAISGRRVVVRCAAIHVIRNRGAARALRTVSAHSRLRRPFVLSVHRRTVTKTLVATSIGGRTGSIVCLDRGATIAIGIATGIGRGAGCVANIT